MPARTPLSAANCPKRSRRPAPMAVRIATSFCRLSARTRRRFATLAQAIRRTNETVPRRIQSAVRTSPTTTSR